MNSIENDGNVAVLITSLIDTKKHQKNEYFLIEK